MRLIPVLAISLSLLVLGVAMGSCVRNQPWMRERHEKIFGWWCKKQGGQNFRMEGWTVHCEFEVNKHGEIIRP